MEMTQVKYITAYLISYISEYCPGTNLGGEYNAKYFVFIPLQLYSIWCQVSLGVGRIE